MKFVDFFEIYAIVPINDYLTDNFNKSVRNKKMKKSKLLTTARVK
jgi:hypothetical protein